MNPFPKKITTISQLKECGFGQPWPRHGLKLLFWFAKHCIWVKGDNMFLACDPTKEDFGFHLFENRCTKRKGKLLPDVNFPYYLLGDLNSPGADMLPNHIKEHNTGQQDDSNADRIIVTTHGQWRFGKIYVSMHKDQSSFDPYATFHISRRLLKIIRSFPNPDDFLLTIGYQKPAFQMLKLSLTYTAVYDNDSAETDTPSRNCVCICTIL
ncbi:uncharacterized protein LOC107703734 [Sinocyclocheilus anshuiensis]|uniref:uncharacterized protein LOC107703734 n=1 Tax=Sinocyclocheilus anshuiensis TaxID=1608454 RepID=UPI0007B8A6C6|nr:PREDICTED: uncharacterized protein LOC107703734 [Sinocyclocheilus anshuiensis]